MKKSSYLYINCLDVRLDIIELNNKLFDFCVEKKIDTLVLDNYQQDIKLVNVSQLIITSQTHYDLDFLDTLQLYPLDYEEFLAYEHKYDSTALNHFFQLAGFPYMHKVSSDNRYFYIQNMLKCTLTDIEFSIIKLATNMMSQKVSAYTMYERLKTVRKISKDKLYRSYDRLLKDNYIHLLEKFNHTKATKKLYLCDISLKSALSTDKHFGRLFENMIFLELLKQNIECYYDDGIDFYLPSTNEIILGMPFSDERTLFKKLEKIEPFLFSYQIGKVTAITMNKEGNVAHPLSKVEMLPFDIWALGD
ncbi:MAG: ATP-binding protein [Campylobacterota bacterium]|nr:ATP-binding protein [Campylobacterota bacterium]